MMKKRVKNPCQWLLMQRPLNVILSRVCVLGRMKNNETRERRINRKKPWGSKLGHATKQFKSMSKQAATGW
jgi:hypothetical protein